MKLDEVRANEELVKWWTKVYHHQNFQKGIKVMLEDTHPLRFLDANPVTTPGSDRRLGMIEGYELALERLKLSAQYQPSIETTLNPTFEPPEKE